MSSTRARRPVVRGLLPALVFINLVGAVISSLGAPLVPEMAGRAHVSIGTAQWSLTVTVLVSVVATPLMGRLSDGRQRRAVVLTALASVVLGGVLAALAPDFTVLLIGRGLQGLGQGLTPVMIATARAVLPEPKARSAGATLSITNAAGVGLGYPLTGLIALWTGVSGAFWFGTIVALAAFAVAFIVVPAGSSHTATRTDVLGATLLAACLASLPLALSQGNTWGWGSARVLLLLVFAIGTGAWWTRHELTTVRPLVELSLLKHRSVLTADATVLLAGIGMYLLLFLTTRLAQAPRSSGGLGQSVLVSGLLLVPMSAASLLASRITRQTLHRVPLRGHMPISSVLMLVAMVVFATLHGSIWGLLIAMTLGGLGIGMIFSITPDLILAAVPADEVGSAMSFNQIFRYVGYSIGSALSAAILQAETPPSTALPTYRGYTVAGYVGCAMWIITGLFNLAIAHERQPDPADHDQPVHQSA